jgi:hypothetical protein
MVPTMNARARMKQKIARNMNVLLWFSIAACSDPQPTATQQSRNDPITCPPKTHRRYVPWGKEGVAHFCEQFHGKKIGWEKYGKRYEGNWEAEEKNGEFKYYDSHGKVTYLETYSKGKLVVSKKVSSP